MSGTYIELPKSGGGGSGFIDAILDTDSINLTVTGTTLSADLKLSTDAASSGFFKATSTLKSGGGAGLHVEAPIATTSLTGFISSTDWNTFNNKEPAIAAGTTAQYYRGDKSFQTLNVAALLAVTSGSLATAGEIGEIAQAEQSTNTTTGVGSSGSFGNVISLSVTAGSYAIYGTVGFNENGAVLENALQCGVSLSATGVGLADLETTQWAGLLSSTADVIVTTPIRFLNFSSTTTVYLNTKMTYSSGTPRHRGRLVAWRIR
jgi:hypothetical protein